MLEADAEGDAASRCAMDNRTVRSVFVIDPDKRVRLITMYPMQTGRNFTEMLRQSTRSSSRPGTRSRRQRTGSWART
jgi:alkyl hydroperoxide reductase subunit AhpC